MGEKTPTKLVVCELKTRYHQDGWRERAETVHEEHANYMADLWRRGVLWSGGPSLDEDTAMEIFSVDSVEEAMEAQRNAPIYTLGYLYDDEYWEWRPSHWPPACTDIDPNSGKRT
jgi:uncharacterized protein YciI